MGRSVVAIPYRPRPAFLGFHFRRERWAVLVAHRRAGKTVAAINDLIRRAVGKIGLYAYIAPYRSQAKSVAWEYLKHYGAPLIATTNEADLSVRLSNGSMIRLFGADLADSLRGLGFDGVYLDEYGDFRPSVWGSVIRPALSDKEGWAVFGGTPKGRNSFYDVVKAAQGNSDWLSLLLPASISGILPAAELLAAKQHMTEDQYNQEYECSFDAAILGAYYGVEMRKTMEDGRIGKVKYDPALPVFTAWDLGYTDDTAIWWYQLARGEIHLLEYYGASGSSISDLAHVVESKGYEYGRHYLPHDAKAKTLASGGKSVIEQLSRFLGLSKLAIVPDIGVQDGIQAVRMAMPRCWFDAVGCDEGLEALRQYQREYDEDKKAFRNRPRHDWCSHPADAFRMMAVAYTELTPVEIVVKGKIISTMTLDDLWAHHDSKESSRERI